jgi:CRP/FNR family transcriptional regulator
VKHSAAAVELLRQIPWLQNLNDDILADLASASSARAYRENEVVFVEGEPVAGLFLVERGRIKICRFSKEGREYILLIQGAGDTFNDVAALDGGPNPATAIAFSDAVLRRISREELHRIAIRHPDLAWAMLESIASRTRHLVAVVQDLAMRNVRGRLAHLLLAQAEAANRGDLPVSLTQEEMASQLGTVREVVGRSLRMLVAEGIVEIDRNRIVILDRSRLEAEAEV